MKRMLDLLYAGLTTSAYYALPPTYVNRYMSWASCDEIVLLLLLIAAAEGYAL